MNSRSFEAWIETQLAPTLSHGDVFILALQLRIFTSSESIGLHDSEVMDDGCIDRDNVGTLGIVAA